MKNLNTQQTEVMNAPDSKLNIQNSTLTESGLHSFTHSALKVENGAKIKEMNPKNNGEISAGRDAMLASFNDQPESKGREHRVPTQPQDEEANNVHDDLWESNHALITKAIHELMCSLGRVPTKKELAIKTGLSRPTVHKHLHGFAMHPLFVDKEEQFQILSSNVMAKVYEFAMLGDPRAARLYFEITGKLKG